MDTQTPTRSYLTPKSIGIFLAGILLLSMLVIGSLSLNNSGNKKENKSEQLDQAKKPGNISPYTLVYGSWTEKSSQIFGYDLSSGTSGTIAELPQNIKKVSVISPTKLLYIADTNIKDHGSSLTIYDIAEKSSEIVYRSADGFYIDDYVISQSKQYIAVWEIQPNQSSGILLGGKSRVYTAELSRPDRKNIIYSEDSSVSNPVRYPRGILNNGTVFMDRFLPNYVAGWGYGMSVSNFLGTDKKDLDTMQNGTYSTQPALSPNGNYLVFSGYNGTKGDGSTLIGGFKRAQLSANTIELLDTATLERKVLENLSPNNVYPYISWNGDSSVVYYMTTNDTSKNGLYLYNLFDSQSTQFPSNTAQFFVRSLDNQSLLVGNKQTLSSNVGNLGPIYETPFTDLSIVHTNDQSVIPLKLDSSVIQFIDLLPAKYFAENLYSPSNPKFATSNGDNLQIGQIVFKPQIEKERQEEQQDPVEPPPAEQPDPVKPRTGINKPSTPKATPVPSGEEINCQAMARDICSGQHPNDLNARGLCIEDLKPQLKDSGQCNASPLYLYGTAGKKVQIKIHTPIFNTNVSYNDGYMVTLLQNGMLRANGNTVTSLSFDYRSALRNNPTPKTGVMVEREQVGTVLEKFASELGLNEIETLDLLKFGNSAITKKFAFVSFFDHKTSHAILPITFDPKPDVYRNIVFYFKNLDEKPNYSVPPPSFEPIQRHGFTAIEVSGIVE